MNIEDVIFLWNSQADEFNQWDSLGIDEKFDFLLILLKGDHEQSDGIKLIKEERDRQIQKEGWTAEHDDKHINYELSLAAAVYALGAAVNNQDRSVMDTFGTTGTNYDIHKLWPFDRSFHKPESRLRDLIKAGALVAAEIDRLNRVIIVGTNPTNSRK